MEKKILITEEADQYLIDGLIGLGYQCDYEPGISPSGVRDIIHEYTGLIVATRIIVDPPLIDVGQQLKFIARAGSGMENIAFEYAQSKNIVCINSPEGNANSVGEHAVGLLLAFYHNITKSFSELKELKWLVQENRVHELEGKTVGIVGYGNTGKSFAKKLSPFGVKVIVYDKYLSNYSDQFATESAMEQLWEDAEILSFHIPLTQETFHLVNNDFVSRCHKKTFLINTSRGKIINHEDLLSAIEENKLAGAALDVYENEKFEMHTEIERKIFEGLMNTGKVIFTPHIAGKSFESKRKIAEVLLRKIQLIV